MFTRLFLLAEIHNFTAEEHRQYIKSLELMSEWDNIINSTAERERAEGRAEERAKIIAQMLGAGFPEDKVAEALGITVEECLSYKR